MNEADFIFSKSKELSLSGIKNFPIDFINTKKMSEVDVPDKMLVLGKECWVSCEVSSPTGDLIMTVTNEYEAKYIVYASQNRKSKIKIPADLTSTKKCVEDYENYLDQLLREIENDYQKKINYGKNYTSVSSQIFKKLNLTRL